MAQKYIDVSQNSLKYYRDLKNVLDTQFLEGREEGRQEGQQEAKATIARQMKQAGFAPEQIAQLTGLTDEQIRNL